MEVHDNQAGSCTQDDAILSDPDFSYDSQADGTMSFSSIANSPPTGFAVPEVCAITCKQCKVLKEDNAKLLNVLTLSEDAFAQDEEKNQILYWFAQLWYTKTCSYISSSDRKKIQIEYVSTNFAHTDETQT